MYPHRIRLRGPWKCEPSGLPGRLRFRRSFGYPGRIDAYERVWLTFAGINGAAEAHLNKHPLGRLGTACEFEVTALLRPRNELVVEIAGDAEQRGFPGEVALEVRCMAFLRALRRSSIVRGDSVELRVSGQVVGMADRPLEVYLLLDRSVVGYQVVTATAEGKAFEIIATDLPAAKWRGPEGCLQALPVQVDLVNGAVVWYTSSGEATWEMGPDEDS
ncbi:MAG TPA: hypothetical protein VMG10_09075 [Gemmataceae bacterium]|nr:hypothetical protein [Gemmataceae bacterium]